MYLLSLVQMGDGEEAGLQQAGTPKLLTSCFLKTGKSHS